MRDADGYGDISSFIDRLAAEAPAPGNALETTRAVRRARRRLVRNGVLSALGAAVVVLGAGAALQASGRSALPIPAHTVKPSTTSTARTSSFYMPAVVELDGSVQAAVIGLPHDARALSMSPDGRLVAFTVAIGGSQRIGTIGTDGADLRFVADVPWPSSASPGVWSAPSWSPDGARIAIASAGQILVMDADGAHLHPVTFGKGVDQWPTWSPDGSTIAYSHSDGDVGDSGFSPTEEIWTVPVSGGAPSRLTNNTGPADDMPSFSPDGSRIAYYRDGEIWLMDRNGRNQHALILRRGGAPGNYTPRWSPDGSSIAFQTGSPGMRTADNEGLATIRVVDLSTRRVTTLPGKVAIDEDAPSWLGRALLMNRYPPSAEVRAPT
jgi:Tol biopolymer transport system component